MEAMVKIRLFKDHGEYRDPVFAAVNGRTYLIQRGEEVEVPTCVAEVLENSMRQQQAAEENAPVRILQKCRTQNRPKMM